MLRKSIGYCAALVLVLTAGSTSAETLTMKEKLGKNLYFDVRLSSPAGQSCASCHSPGAGFNGTGDGSIAVYEGAVSGRFGNRNPPSAAYASFSPTFSFDAEAGMYVGGQFWDGRAATLADQAKGPFLNPVEQNNPSKKDVVKNVLNSNYRDLFIKVYGNKDLAKIDQAYDAIADAVAAYESSTEVNKFSSKYDWHLKNPLNNKLSSQETMGLHLFNGKAKCNVCHPSVSGPYSDKPLFTDFTYDNLGIPKNSADSVPPDLGLGAIVNDYLQNGKFKVPTLRNVGVAPSYAHNGYFKNLKEIVHFYNTRDSMSGGESCSGMDDGGMGGGGMGGGGMGGGMGGGGMAENWPPPEVAENLNTTELGHLCLSDMQEDAIVAFLMTLTDGYAPSNPR